jgi:archaemetzincin
LIVEFIIIGEVPRDLLSSLAPKIIESYHSLIRDCQFMVHMSPPDVAYHPGRGQYRSDVLLKHLCRFTKGCDKVLALTDVDLFTPGLNFVFGQAQCPGKIALVSIHRLDPTKYGAPPNPTLLLERTTKEAIHELGHTFGLQHCTSPRCVMAFSNSVMEVDKKTAKFCARCINRLAANRPSPFYSHDSL